jgi:uncharacterized protein (DUF58 family)
MSRYFNFFKNLFGFKNNKKAKTEIQPYKPETPQPPSSLDTKDLLKKVRKIEIKTKGLSNQVFAGSYHSAFKGRGMSFSEVRAYDYGDDVRNIDWNVTARFDEPYIKVFEEEREINLMLLIDISNSTFFGTQNQFKNEIIAEIAAVLSFSAIQNNDKVGVIFFSNKVEKFIPPKKGKSHILRIIRELINNRPSVGGTNISEALKYLNNIIKRRSIVFVISDFLFENNYKDALTIAKKRHDLVGIHLYDEREREMPNVGLMQVVDSETGKSIWLDSSLRSDRKIYNKKFEENLQKHQKTFLQSKADFISIDTKAKYSQALMNLFKKREKRR